jgi:hypothetical protein
MAYDIIGDIHGHADELVALLDKLNYRHDGYCYRHNDRQAIFLGDFIDRGSQQRAVINIVMPMVKSGAAQSVLANHEFNALAFHTKDPELSNEWLRPHNFKNIKQHERFLEEFGAADHKDELKKVLDWFYTLPLWLELDGIRVIHACWHEPSIKSLYGKLGPNNTLTRDLLIKASRKDTAEYQAIEVLLKGWEQPLPNGSYFKDKDGNVRREIRTKWWLNGPVSLNEASLLPDLISSSSLAESALIELPGYSESEPLVFVGHYWLTGEPTPLANNVACLDYSVAKNGKLVAYRWNGESRLNKNNYVFV